MFRKARSGLTNPQRENKSATDRGKPVPTLPRRRHQPALHDALAQTGPLDSRSAVEHRNGHQTATLVRPPPLSRTASTASSMSRQGRALSPRATCSEPLDRSKTRTCGTGCRLRGKGQSIQELHGCVRPDIPPRPEAAEIAPGSFQGLVHQPGYCGATCSSQARLYKAPTVCLTFGSRTTSNRQRCIFPPPGALTRANSPSEKSVSV
jgi:hypothetical protein